MAICIWTILKKLFFGTSFLFCTYFQIYLSWKSGPAEVKHWKDMMSHPRTAVAQWHALKAWWPRPPKVNNTFKTLLICTSLTRVPKAIQLSFFPSLSLSFFLFLQFAFGDPTFVHNFIFLPTKKEAKHCQEDRERYSRIEAVTDLSSSSLLRAGWLLSSIFNR